MDVPGDREEKSIWVSGGWRYSWNCVSDDSVAFYRNVSVSFFWIASAKFFYDSVFATALSIALAVRMGYRGMQDATIFFLTENDRLWVMDARGLSSHGDGFLGFAISSMETQAFLRRQGKQPFLPKGADEILKVLSIKENRSHYAFRCQACHSDRHVVRRTYFLVKGIQDEQMLLQELERRKTWENVLEPAENRNPLYILLSGAAFIFCVILCILSHPSVARMSGEIYFPCMGASMVTFCFLLYFIIRQHRGE